MSGAGHPETQSTIDRCAITGNRISGLFTYGGGVFSDGGSIGQSKKLRLTNCTIARNLVEPAPGLPRFVLALGYWRGGGCYMSNGNLEIQSCTIVENEVQGVARTDSLGRRNLAGGIAATVGNAHEVGEMILSHSIVTGNTVQEVGGRLYPHDIFSGSLLSFRSGGHNRIGALDFSNLLVPVGQSGWESLSRKHYPQSGDQDGVALADVLDRSGGLTSSSSILSTGVSAGTPAVLHYRPRGSALGQVPASAYQLPETVAEYEIVPGARDNFLEIFLARLEHHYGLTHFASQFTADFETFLSTVDADSTTPGLQPYTSPTGAPILTVADTQWFGPAESWPKELANYPYIEFWHRLDAALQAAIPALAPELLADESWRSLFTSGPLLENPNLRMRVVTTLRLSVQRPALDQVRAARPANGPGDIGAIEVP